MSASNWGSATAFRTAAAWLATFIACACATTPAAQVAPAASSTPPAAAGSEPSLQDRDWGVVRSNAQGIKLALPEARAWHELRHATQRGESWELRHEPTGSTLTIKRWRASRLPRVDACQAELVATATDIATADETSLVSSRDIRVPTGFATRITLLALPGSRRRLRGQAQAVSAGVGECIAAIVRTECSDETELAERFRLFDTALSHLRLIHIDDRVPDRAPLPR